MPEPSDLGVSTCRCVIPFACDYTMHVSFSIFERQHHVSFSIAPVITLCVDVGHARRLCKRRELGQERLRGFPTAAALLAAISERCKRHASVAPGTLGMTSPKGFLLRHASKKSSGTNVYRKFEMRT